MEIIKTAKKMKVTKAIFPVAGFGTRFLPATKAQPKEMLPVVDKPAIQYLVENAVEAGVEEIVFITGRGKRAIEDHFDYSFELDHNLAEKNKPDLVEEVRRISNLANFCYVRQPMPLGDGHAIGCAAHLVGDEPILVMFGDTLYDAQSSPAHQLIEAYDEHQACIIGLAKVDHSRVSEFGVIDGRSIGRGDWLISRFVEKPKPEEAPSNLAAVGVYVITPEIFTVLADMGNGETGEIRLADAFARFIAEGGKIIGRELDGDWLDTGSKFGWLKANIILGLKNKEIGQELKRFLKDLN